MSPLARQTGCSVVAFDRPGWGLTSRPSKTEWEEKKMPNPYELQSQVNVHETNHQQQLLINQFVMVCSGL